MAARGHAFNSPSAAFGRCWAVSVRLMFVDSVIKMSCSTGVTSCRCMTPRMMAKSSQETALGPVGAALYCPVSSDAQTIDNQLQELRDDMDARRRRALPSRRRLASWRSTS